MSKKHAAFFDLDKTISSVDTITRFIPFYISKRPMRFFRLFYIGFIGLLTLLKICSNECFKRSLSMLFSGESYNALSKMGKDFAYNIAKKYYYNDALLEIEKRKKEGCVLVLISASYEFYVKHIGESLGFDYSFGTLLWRHEDRVSGKLYGRNLRYDEKCMRLRAQPFYSSLSLDESYSYSDSFSDLPLLKLSGNPFCVNPDKKLKRYAEKEGFSILRFKETSA